MELLLPLLWWCDGVSLTSALLVYLVHRLEMPEYPAALYQPLLRLLARLAQSPVADFSGVNYRTAHAQ